MFTSNVKVVRVILIWYILYFVDKSASQLCGTRDLSLVEPRRKCRKACTTDADCRGALKRCNCDDVCGMSCFNPNAVCPLSSFFLNGEILGNERTYATKVTYRCFRGYYLVGSSTRTCRSDRKWSGAAPTCRRGCGFPANFGLAYPNAAKNNYEAGETITYSCGSEQLLTGNPRVTCTSSGWSPPAFFCSSRGCNDPGTPTNGYREGEDFRYGRTVSFFCNKGYELSQSQNIILCNAYGKWDGVIPTCEKFICGILRPTRSSVPSSNKTKFTIGDVVTFRCLPGYRLEGNPDVTCEPGGWSSLNFHCFRIGCPDPGIPLHGYRQGEIFRIGRTVHFFCNVGYKLLQKENFIVCGRNGKWSGITPSCEIVRCLALISPNHGLVNDRGVDYTYGSEVTYSCEFGYNLHGDPTGRCNKNGNWGVIPTCIAINACNSSPCRNGGSCISGENIYSCLCMDGFRGTHCEGIISCSQRRIPRFSTIRPSAKDAWIVGDFATYTCNVGYTMIGSDTSVCLPSGKWSDSTPTCQANPCTSNPCTNGGSCMVNGNSYTCGCLPGFLGSNCDQVDPCILNPCENGGTCVSSRNGYTCLCLRGYKGSNCELEIYCIVPRPPQFGTISVPSLSRVVVDGTITYQCNRKYRMESQSTGRLTATCREDERWSARVPTCVEISCSNRLKPANARPSAIKSRWVVDDVLSYTCNEGYDLVGSASSSCLSSGRWSNDLPQCTSNPCTSNPCTNGGSCMVNGNSYTCGCLPGFLGSNCDQVDPCILNPCENGGTCVSSRNGYTCLCLRGYKGSNCELEIYCIVPRPPQFGTISVPSLSRVVVDGTITYQCNRKYRMESQSTGRLTATCREDERWSARVPACVEINCSNRLTPTNARPSAIKSRWVVDEVLSYTCDTGYNLMGPASSTCLLSGRWSNDLPHCILVRCRAPLPPNQGSVDDRKAEHIYGSEVRYSCDIGYKLNGIAIGRCNENRTWGELPTCVVDTDCNFEDFQQPTCGYQNLGVLWERTFSSNVPNGLLGFVARATFTSSQLNMDARLLSPKISRENSLCLKFYYLLGRISSSRDFTLSLVSRSGAKQRIWSPDLRDRRNVWHSTDYAFDSDVGDLQIEFRARKRIRTNTMIDLDEITITEDIECVDECDTNPCRNGGSCVNRIDDYTCYCITGFEGRNCDTVMSCVVPNPPRFGTSSVPSSRRVSIGSTITYRCNDKYRMEGQHTGRLKVTCRENRKWSAPVPTCVEIQCIVPRAPQFGTVSVRTSRVALDGIITYQCNHRYRMEGRPTGRLTVTCREDTTWSARVPTCVKITCLPRSTPRNSRPSSTRSRWVVDEVLSYTCNKGFDLIGSASSTCLLSGRWSNELPRCKRDNCAQLLPFNNGEIIGTSRRRGARVTYRCHRGFILNGSSTRTCRSGKQWSGAAPTCRLISCERPLFLFNISYASVDRLNELSLNYSDVVKVECNQWYEVVSGASEWICSEDGSWKSVDPSDTAVPVCKPVCGVKNALGPRNLITIHVAGGNPTKRNEWPWMVFLNFGIQNNVATNNYYCGGTLISERYVVTAAHCLTTRTFLYPPDGIRYANEIYVWVGAHNRLEDRIGNTAARVYRVEEVMRHSEYDSINADNDIALLRLAETVIMNDYVRPICVPTAHEKQNLLVPGAVGTVTGWGLNSRFFASAILQEIELPVVNITECLSGFNQLARDLNLLLGSFTVTDNMFCSGFSNGQILSTCGGDSGGPWMLEHRSKYYIFGVVSYGISSSNCGSAATYSVFTKIAPNFVDWIKSNTDLD